MAMFSSAQSLWTKLNKGKASSKTYKAISGVSVRLAWSGSATELAAQPAADVYVDERDRMDDIPGEGDVVTLADARHSTYPDGKTIVTSTPTIGNVETKHHKLTGFEHWDEDTDPEDIVSPIWKLWMQGTKYEWSWPCPECEEYFIPRFKLLKWPEGCSPQKAMHEAALACPHCGSLIPDNQKSKMNARGVYIAPGQTVDKDGNIDGDIPENDTASFWVSGLCSPWKTFGERAKAWLEAVRSGDPGRIQAVLNTGFGELYKTGADSPEWQLVFDRCRSYSTGTIPQDASDRGLALVLTVDVQKNRLEFVVRMWGYGMESWLIDQGQLYGETAHDSVWTDLETLMERKYGLHHIKIALIDSGYNPGDSHKQPVNKIYEFCRRHPGIARATKGKDTQEKPIRANHIDVNYGGRTIKRGLQLWHIDTNFTKSFVYSRIQVPDGEPDLWHLPEDITEDYAKQVTAEAPVNKPSGQVVWVRNRKDNHMLDCEAMQVAAAYMLRIQDKRPRSSSSDQKQPSARGDSYVRNGVKRRRSTFL